MDLRPSKSKEICQCSLFGSLLVIVALLRIANLTHLSPYLVIDVYLEQHAKVSLMKACLLDFTFACTGNVRLVVAQAN